MSVSPTLLVDFGMGNLRNVARAVERAGGQAAVAEGPDALRHASRVIVPGVGAAGDAMSHLQKTGLDAALCEHVAQGRPYLGICLGLQVLLDSAEEGEVNCLALLPGRVARFPDRPGLVVPHMGWNEVELLRSHPVLEPGYFYFVHGYRATRVSPSTIAAETEYGERFPSALARDNVVAVQFHPEKSQQAGQALIERFLHWLP